MNQFNEIITLIVGSIVAALVEILRRYLSEHKKPTADTVLATVEQSVTTATLAVPSQQPATPPRQPTTLAPPPTPDPPETP